ncbi:MAG: hypothetical protein KJ799_09950 [Bacteroidetes bacterium]|nr:hypothetical protein [Bacteroidota bacterium]MBU1681007.1 hypothetical protein [Bacteroidota bacterium]MBU2507031.1 hypothetical protein [Bacteroidota bacterium]
MNNPKSVFSISILFLILIGSLNYTEAIPSFARKYKTSCATCHAPYPKLNPFGEAFRQNGYRFPGGDEQFTKEEPVSIGSEAYKRVWPEAIWPSSLPGTSPVSFRTRFNYTVDKNDANELESTFNPPALQVIATGTFGDDVSFYVGAHLFEDGEVGSIDRAFIRLNDLFASSLEGNVLNLRIGQFIPDIVPFATNHRGIYNTAFAFNTYSPLMGESFGGAHGHGNTPFGIEQFQLGAEVTGVITHSLKYTAGLVNGNFANADNNSKRDIYGRLSYKFGGLGYDGYTEDQSATSYENSFALGVLTYSGIGTESEVNYDITRFGVDFNLYLQKLNVFGGYITGIDGDEELNYNLFFAEATYEVYPWLFGSCRYEQASPEGLSTIKRATPNITALYIANVKFLVESRIDLDNPEFDNLFVGIDFAF